MKPEDIQAFNEELKVLLDKYQVNLAVEEVPASQRITIVPRKQETAEDNTPEVKE